MGWRGILGGALALIALQTLVQPDAAKRAGGIVDWLVGGAYRFLDPAVPALGPKPQAPVAEGSPAPAKPASVETASAPSEPAANAYPATDQTHNIDPLTGKPLVSI